MKLESGSTTVTAGLIHDHLQAFLFLERERWLFFLSETSEQGAELEHPCQNTTPQPWAGMGSVCSVSHACLSEPPVPYVSFYKHRSLLVGFVVWDGCCEVCRCGDTHCTLWNCTQINLYFFKESLLFKTLLKSWSLRFTTGDRECWARLKTSPKFLTNF